MRSFAPILLALALLATPALAPNQDDANPPSPGPTAPNGTAI